MEWRLTKKFCDQENFVTKIFRDLTRKFVGLNIKKSVLTTKMRVFDHKNMYLTMKLEPVLTTKIVDNFVRFGMP